MAEVNTYLQNLDDHAFRSWPVAIDLFSLHGKHQNQAIQSATFFQKAGQKQNNTISKTFSENAISIYFVLHVKLQHYNGNLKYCNYYRFLWKLSHKLWRKSLCQDRCPNFWHKKCTVTVSWKTRAVIRCTWVKMHKSYPLVLLLSVREYEIKQKVMRFLCALTSLLLILVTIFTTKKKNHRN